MNGKRKLSPTNQGQNNYIYGGMSSQQTTGKTIPISKTANITPP
jgi:hypothetical protein